MPVVLGVASAPAAAVRTAPSFRVSALAGATGHGKPRVSLLFHNLLSGTVQHNVFVATTTDGGASFGAPVPISPPPQLDYLDLQCADSGGPSNIVADTPARPGAGPDRELFPMLCSGIGQTKVKILRRRTPELKKPPYPQKHAPSTPCPTYCRCRSPGCGRNWSGLTGQPGPLDAGCRARCRTSPCCQH